jgi:hypothetical protein
MFNNCDACRRPNPSELMQIQAERGELVASKLGLALRPRTRDLFVLCADCGDLALARLREVIAQQGIVGLRSTQAS